MIADPNSVILDEGAGGTKEYDPSIRSTMYPVPVDVTISAGNANTIGPVLIVIASRRALK